MTEETKELEATIATLEAFIRAEVKRCWPQPINEEVDPIVNSFYDFQRGKVEGGSSNATLNGVYRATRFLESVFSNKND